MNDTEIELIKRMESQLADVNKIVQDVRDRVIRIEAQDVALKVGKLEDRVRVLEEWRSKLVGQVTLIVVPIAAAIGACFKWLFDRL